MVTVVDGYKSADDQPALGDTANLSAESERVYRQFQRDYQDAKQAYDDALSEARKDPHALENWPTTGATYRLRVNDAYDRLLSLGHRKNVESTRKTHRPAQHPRPNDSYSGELDAD
ncbi:hypothetical protein [Orlajensenia leifsoniae]|uniref:Uncharacterized protein n=1 Tax=Orlajensenia leifsoniae TaxID=2561933 RepID=A0A4Y9QRH3_9MICO|nr:hypothetical protein [Leifsonia flava]TFV94867.1 hypothetical protein E4M00_17075 [Leifsonia flava]